MFLHSPLQKAYDNQNTYCLLSQIRTEGVKWKIAKKKQRIERQMLNSR